MSLLDDRLSETVTITPDGRQPSLQLSTCLSNNPRSPSGSPSAGSPLHRCDSPAAAGGRVSILAAALDPPGPDQMWPDRLREGIPAQTWLREWEWEWEWASDGGRPSARGRAESSDQTLG